MILHYPPYIRSFPYHFKTLLHIYHIKCSTFNAFTSFSPQIPSVRYEQKNTTKKHKFFNQEIDNKVLTEQLIHHNLSAFPPQLTVEKHKQTRKRKFHDFTNLSQFEILTH